MPFLIQKHEKRGTAGTPCTPAIFGEGLDIFYPISLSTSRVCRLYGLIQYTIQFSAEEKMLH